MIKLTLRYLCICLILLAITGCAWWNRDNSLPPSELVTLGADLVNADKVWSSSPGDGVGDNYLRLRPLVTPESVLTVDHKGHLTAVSTQKGSTQWKVDLDVSVTAGVNGDAETVLAGSKEGLLIALQSSDGTERWQKQFIAEISSISAVVDNIVIIRTLDGAVYGVNALDGVINWQSKYDTPELSIRGHGEPIIVGGRVFIGLDDGRLVAHALKTGQILWQQIVSFARGRTEIDRLDDVDGQIKIMDGRLYVVGYQGSIVALDPSNGKVFWRQDASSITGVDVDTNAVYFSNEEGVVSALDQRNGDTIWQQEQLKYRLVGTPRVFGDYVVVGDLEGYLHWYDRQTGDLASRVKAGSRQFTSSLHVVSNQLYALDSKGRLSAWRLP